MQVKEWRFLDYGTLVEPAQGVLVLDVGRLLVPGVLDHHQEDGEAECAASLVVSHPTLVLDHLRGREEVTLVTHKSPDFDAVAASYLSLRLLEEGKVTLGMRKLGGYAKIVDSASLPRTVSLVDTPYTHLYAAFQTIPPPSLPGESREARAQRVGERRMKVGFEMMSKWEKAAETGEELLENPNLFRGDRDFEKSGKIVQEDYLSYSGDCRRARKGRTLLSTIDGNGLLPVDWLMVLRPRSFLLKEWARRDFTGSPSGNGFSLIISSLYEGNFMIATSPDSGTHLRGLGTLLNRREEERRRREGAPLLEWYDGNSPFFRYRIVANPKGGTLLSPEEVFQTFQEYISSLGPIHT